MSFDPQPTNPFGWLLLLLLSLAAFMLFGVQSSSELTTVPDTRGRPDGVTVPRPPRGGLHLDGADLLGVEQVDVIVRESYPPQVMLHITGYWPDGCVRDPQVTTMREGDSVIVRISRNLPPDVMCTQVMSRVEIDVPLNDVLIEAQSFRSGSYTIDVNGVLTEASF